MKREEIVNGIFKSFYNIFNVLKTEKLKKSEEMK